MIKFKHLAAAMILFATSMSANAGIPVIDGTAVVNLILSYTTQVEQYAQQVQQYTTQLQQYQTAVSHLSAITGSRGMGALVNNQTVRQAVPPSVYNAANSLTSLTTNAATPAAQLSSAAGRVGQLTSLIQAVDAAPDEKAALDLQNRIAAEHAYLLNEQTMIQAAKDNQVAQAAIEAYNNKAAGTALLHGTVAPF
jgi:type IV secretion system protein VirB5